MSLHRFAVSSALCAMVCPVSAPVAADPLLGSVLISQSDGVVLKSPYSIASVLVADPGIANVQPLSEDTLFLIGKSVGATRLFILDDKNEILSEHRIVVSTALSALSR